MVVKILRSSATFSGIKYNFEKVAKGFAELLSAKNFDSLQGVERIKPEDYKNYLQMLTARNTRIKQPQFHVVISTKGKTHTKEELNAITEKWMKAMGYARQPYLVFFHKDTDDNHVHIVSTRIDREGKKISSEFERVRAVAAMNKIMGLDENKQIEKDIAAAKAYRFSTIPQFKMILESQGYVLKNNDVIKFGKKLAEIEYQKLIFKELDDARIRQLKAIFSKYTITLKEEEFKVYMREKHGIQLVFHSKDGKLAYGYSIIDHAQKNVFKGSAVMPLKEMQTLHNVLENKPATALASEELFSAKQQRTSASFTPRDNKPLNKGTQPAIQISISNDVDDEAIYGMKRRRKRKARTNQR